MENLPSGSEPPSRAKKSAMLVLCFHWAAVRESTTGIGVNIGGNSKPLSVCLVFYCYLNEVESESVH